MKVCGDRPLDGRFIVFFFVFFSICCRSQRCPWRPWKNPLPFPPSTPSRPPLRALRWWRAATALNSGQCSSCVPWFYMNKYHVEQIGLWAECHTLYMDISTINPPSSHLFLLWYICIRCLRLKKCLNSQHVFVEDLTSGQMPSSPQSSLPECRVLSQSTTDKLTDTTVDWRNCRLIYFVKVWFPETRKSKDAQESLKSPDSTRNIVSFT